VQLTIFRPAIGDTLELEVIRGRVAFEHVPFAGVVDDKMLYLKLDDFSPLAGATVREALDSLLQDYEINGIILDLRDNPGGLLNEACETADLFLDRGQFIVGTEGRSYWQRESFVAGEPDFTDGLPLAVLVNGGSASAAEIVAGSLQHAGRAILIGDTTYGKGLVQGYRRFALGDGLRLTISRYYFEGGYYLNQFDTVLHDVGHGLIPDFYFDSNDQSDFRTALEASLLLPQFAFGSQDLILEAAENGELIDACIADLRQFIKERDFEYKSPLSEQTESTLADLAYHDSDRSADRLLAQLDSLARVQDASLFEHNHEWLWTRLLALATQRRFSTYQAYRDVIVPNSPIVAYAAELLLKRTQEDDSDISL
jgi:carboxyl-terminal processing protease